jgi:hypothetical protein
MVRSGAGFQPVAFGYAKARTPGNQPPQAGSLCHQNSHPLGLIYSLNGCEWTYSLEGRIAWTPKVS